MCAEHMEGNHEQADLHYQAVIRRFVVEALELSEFIDKAAHNREKINLQSTFGSNHSSLYRRRSLQLEVLDFNDWVIWKFSNIL